MMMSFLIVGTIVGMLLGLRFKVFVLVPTTLIAACVIVATGHEGRIVAATVLATTALLQIGYLTGHADASRQEQIGLSHYKPTWF